jgi:hypothetical protein
MSSIQEEMVAITTRVLEQMLHMLVVSAVKDLKDLEKSEPCNIDKIRMAGDRVRLAKARASRFGKELPSRECAFEYGISSEICDTKAKLEAMLEYETRYLQTLQNRESVEISAQSQRVHDAWRKLAEFSNCPSGNESGNDEETGSVRNEEEPDARDDDEKSVTDISEEEKVQMGLLETIGETLAHNLDRTDPSIREQQDELHKMVIQEVNTYKHVSQSEFSTVYDIEEQAKRVRSAKARSGEFSRAHKIPPYE